MRNWIPLGIFFLKSLAGISQAIEARVGPFNNRPTIFINNTPEYPMFYSLTDVPGGRWTWEEVPRYNLKSFCELGVKLIQVDLAFDHVWKEDGTIVLDTAQRQLKGVLDVCPGAAIFIRFHVNPPKWWQKKYPEENCVYADTEAKPDIDWGIQRIIEDDEETPKRHSLASIKWKTEATEKLKEFLSQLQRLPEANALAGIQVAGGVYGEWHYWGFIENEPDMSKPMRVYFQDWLRTKYKTDKGLQEAWKKPSITIATIQLPTLQERRETKGGIFRDPSQERNVIDYYEAQHQVVADVILHFCKVVKEHWPRPIITGAFYGYFYSVFGREAAGGHLELLRVLKSPYIDYLSSPGSYYPAARETGDPYRSRSLINSVTLHGKLWLDEMDQQPPLVPLKEKTFQESLDKSIANTRRNVMFTLTHGQGLWFYDFGPAGFNGGPRLVDHGSFGWWDEPTLRADIKRLKQLGDQQLQKPFERDADVLLVHDTESFYHLGSDRRRSGLSHWANNWTPVGIFRSGVVHDAIHIDDLDKMQLDKYKAIVFVNTFLLTKQQKKVIQGKVKKQNRHVIWIYAPGYSDGSELNVSFVKETTGFNLEQGKEIEKVTLTMDSTVVGNYTFSLNNALVSPYFVVKDDHAISMGTVNSSNAVGFAKKEFKTNTSWFMCLPLDHPKVWQYIFKEAGAHIYSKTGEIFYSGNGVLTVHSKEGGTKVITLKNGKEVSLSTAPNSTTIIDSATGEILLR